MGCLLLGFWEKIDRVITAPHCILSRPPPHGGGGGGDSLMKESPNYKIIIYDEKIYQLP